MNEKNYMVVLDNAVTIYHKVCDEHDLPSCNCFREEFGKWLYKYLKVEGNPYLQEKINGN